MTQIIDNAAADDDEEDDDDDAGGGGAAAADAGAGDVTLPSEFLTKHRGRHVIIGENCVLRPSYKKYKARCH